MNIESIRALSGPSLWSDQPVLEAIVTLDKSGFDAGVLSRLCALLPPALASELPRGLGACDTPAAWAAVLAKLTVGLQAAADCAVAFWVTRELKVGAEYRVVTEYAEEVTGRRALE